MADPQIPIWREAVEKTADSPLPARPPSGELDAPSTRRFREELLSRIETRLAADANAPGLQFERAHLLAELKRPKEAAQAFCQAVISKAPRHPDLRRAYTFWPYRGKGEPATALLLVPPFWGNAPFRKYLDDQTFLALQIITDFHDPGLSLPPHQFVINCISDADCCVSSLKAAEAILAQTQAPVINRPDKILATGRQTNSRRLASIPGVVTPNVITLPKLSLKGSEGAAFLAQNGFPFPLLLRAPGFHTGLHFERVEKPQDFEAALAKIPGESVTVLQFLDARSADGKIRKYRVMMINGKFYPAHLAISEAWKVHYFSAAMADFPEHRAEDKAFLEEMPTVLGPRAMEALRQIQNALQLDYAGVDFSLNANGDLLLFEANATMNINPPDKNEIWAYRRAPIQRIAEAVRNLFLHRASLKSNV